MLLTDSDVIPIHGERAQPEMAASQRGRIPSSSARHRSGVMMARFGIVAAYRACALIAPSTYRTHASIPRSMR